MREMLVSWLVISAVALAAGAGTYAYFSDVETSEGNVVTSGPFDLLIKDNSPNEWSDGVSETWVSGDMKPGAMLEGKYVKLLLQWNPESNPGDHVEIGVDYNVIEENPRLESDTDPGTDLEPDEMAKNITIYYFQYDDDRSINLLTGDDMFTASNENRSDWRVDDVDGDGRVSVYDFKMDPLDNLPPPYHPFQDTTFRMNLKLMENASNDFQGDVLNITVYFTLNQDSSQ